VRKRDLALLPLSFVLACGGASVAPVIPQAETVKVGKDRPAPGSKELGPVDVEHGSGCGILGDRGSYEGAVALARNRAANLGADYVELVKVTGPHMDPVCYDNRYVIHGIAFKLGNGPSALAARPAVNGCDPPCSPGYTCNAGTCSAVCNPPCAGGQVCKQDRTCGVSLADALGAPPDAGVAGARDGDAASGTNPTPTPLAPRPIDGAGGT
jgi:hypothetical protein